MSGPNLGVNLSAEGAQSALSKAGFKIVVNKDGSLAAVNGDVRVNFPMSPKNGSTAEVQINKREVLKIRLYID
jgi:hypothetical protein